MGQGVQVHGGEHGLGAPEEGGAEGDRTCATLEQRARLLTGHDATGRQDRQLGARPHGGEQSRGRQVLLAVVDRTTAVATGLPSLRDDTVDTELLRPLGLRGVVDGHPHLAADVLQALDIVPARPSEREGHDGHRVADQQVDLGLIPVVVPTGSAQLHARVGRPRSQARGIPHRLGVGERRVRGGHEDIDPEGCGREGADCGGLGPMIGVGRAQGVDIHLRVPSVCWQRCR